VSRRKRSKPWPHARTEGEGNLIAKVTLSSGGAGRPEPGREGTADSAKTYAERERKETERNLLQRTQGGSVQGRISIGLVPGGRGKRRRGRLGSAAYLLDGAQGVGDDDENQGGGESFGGKGIGLPKKQNSSQYDSGRPRKHAAGEIRVGERGGVPCITVCSGRKKNGAGGLDGKTKHPSQVDQGKWKADVVQGRQMYPQPE